MMVWSLSPVGTLLNAGLLYVTLVAVGARWDHPLLWLSVVIFYVRRHSAGGRRDAVVDADARLVNG